MLKEQPNTTETNRSNVDPLEIENFSKLAKDWWDLDGSSKALHQINPLRLQYVEQQHGLLQGERVIDIGCGGGILSESLAQKGAQVTGLDLSHAALSVARQHAHDMNLTIDYVHQSAEQFAQQHPAQFDLVTCMEMLEHVPDPASIIQACATLLKPGGTLILSTINRTFKSKLFMIYGAEQIARLVPKGTHTFDRFIRPSELMTFVEQAHLTINDLSGMRYQLFSQTFCLSDDLEINYLLSAQK